MGLNRRITISFDDESIDVKEAFSVAHNHMLNFKGDNMVDRDQNDPNIFSIRTEINGTCNVKKENYLVFRR